MIIVDTLIISMCVDMRSAWAYILTHVSTWCVVGVCMLYAWANVCPFSINYVNTNDYRWPSEFLRLCRNLTQFTYKSFFILSFSILSLLDLMDGVDLVGEINKASSWIHLVSAGVPASTNCTAENKSVPPQQGVLWLFTLLVDGKFNPLCFDLKWYWILFWSLW